MVIIDGIRPAATEEKGETTMKIIKDERALRRFTSILKKRAEGVNDETVDAVSEILQGIKDRGDRALMEYTERFDGLKVPPFEIPAKEISGLSRLTPPGTVRALKTAARRILEFHKKQVEESWTFRDRGAVMGQIIRPIERIGVYVPGGKASYPSTVLMNVIPAQVAGVKEIALCVPTPHGDINPALMTAIEILGVKEVYRIGGAQAVGALAYGTETIRKVDKIVGPGNIYVATAKRMVFGLVDIDMIAGPSEVLIIADRLARPELIAADLLGQAEHDELASSILITTSADLAERVNSELKEQLKGLRRKGIASSSLRNFGRIIIVKSLKQALGIANDIAPEHLEIMTEDPEKLLPLVRNAGAIFLGEWTPEPLGDYAAGPNHTLPTGGTARFFSPLGVYDFLKRSSLIKFSRRSFLRLAPVVETLSDTEGLEAHGNTIRIRRGPG